MKHVILKLVCDDATIKAYVRDTLNRLKPIYNLQGSLEAVKNMWNSENLRQIDFKSTDLTTLTEGENGNYIELQVLYADPINLSVY